MSTKEDVGRPLVSVIMPSLNVAEYVRESIESVINQSLNAIEIICVDAGSTDGTLEILKEYAKKDSRIKLLHSSKKSYGHQMNLGLGASEGEYVGIVETDDYIKPNMFEALYQLAKEHNHQADFIKGEYEYFYVNANGRKATQRVNSVPDHLFDMMFSPKDGIEIFKGNPTICAGIYKLSFIKENQIVFNETPGASYQDVGFWFQTLYYASCVYFVNEAYFVYRVDRPESSRNETALARASIIFKELEFIYQILLRDEEKRKSFSCGFVYRCFESLKFISHLLSEEDNLQYLKDCHCLLASLQEHGKVDTSLFSKTNEEMFRLLCQSPKDYYRQYCLGLHKSMIEEPKVSVVLPIYNVEKYLHQCLDSVLRQTLKEIEVICVDDGSTDRSLDILKKYQSKDCRVFVLKQNNINAGAARNKGMSIAKGKYLAILDSDDFFESEMLEETHEKAEKEQADLVLFRHNAFQEESNQYSSRDHIAAKEYFPDKGTFCAGEIKGNPYQSVAGWSWDKLFLRSFIEEHQIKFQKISIYNDMSFTYSALMLANRITHLDKIYAHKRYLRAGSISKMVSENWYCSTLALGGVLKTLKENSLYDRFKSEYTTYALHMLLYTLDRTYGKRYVDMYEYMREQAHFLLGDTLHQHSSFTNKEEYERYKGIIETPVTKSLSHNEHLPKRDDYSSYTYQIGRRVMKCLPSKLQGAIRSYVRRKRGNRLMKD